MSRHALVACILLVSLGYTLARRLSAGDSSYVPGAPTELPSPFSSVSESIKSFEVRSRTRSPCKKLSTAKTVSFASVLEANRAVAAAPSLPRTFRLSPAMAPAPHVGLLAPLQQPELVLPAPEEPFPDQEAALTALGLAHPEEISLESMNSPPCSDLPINIFAALARDGFVEK